MLQSHPLLADGETEAQKAAQPQTEAEPDHLSSPRSLNRAPGIFLAWKATPPIRLADGCFVGEVHSCTHRGLLCHRAPEMLDSQSTGWGRGGQDLGTFLGTGNRGAPGEGQWSQDCLCRLYKPSWTSRSKPDVGGMWPRKHGPDLLETFTQNHIMGLPLVVQW